MRNSHGKKPNLNHVDEQFRGLVAASSAEKIAHLAAEWFIPNLKSQSVIDAIKSLLFMPPRKPPMNLVISGPSGCGKSTSIKKLTNTLAQSYVCNDLVQKPAVVLNIPKSLDETDLLLNLMTEMVGDFEHDGSVSDLRGYADKMLIDMHVKVVIIEATDNFVGAPAAQIKALLSAVEMLAARAGVSIVLVVTPDVEALIANSDAQAFTASRVEVGCFDNGAEFQNLLADFERLIPLPEPSMLGYYDMSSLIHMLTNGNLATIKELIVKSATIAINYGDPSINDGHVYAYATRKSMMDSLSFG